MGPLRRPSRTDRGRGRGYDRNSLARRISSGRNNVVQPRVTHAAIPSSSLLQSPDHDAFHIQQLLADNDSHHQNISRLLIITEQFRLFQVVINNSIQRASAIFQERKEQISNLEYNIDLLLKVLEVDYSFDRFMRYFQRHGRAPDKTQLDHCLESDDKLRILMPLANQRIGQRRIDKFLAWLMSLG